MISIESAERSRKAVGTLFADSTDVHWRKVMRYFIFGFFTGALVLGSWSASATAQDTTPSADEPATIEYKAAPAAKPGYD